MARRLIAIVGPTASGKSALAMELAAEAGAEIVSCDSLQVYRGLDIGSAKPTAEERRRVPHHLIDVVDPDEPFSAADYARAAAAAAEGILARGRLPLVVGGTGLYLRALLQGLFEGPSRRPELRQRLEAIAARGGDERLHRLLRRADPDAAERVAVRDRVRVVRALEVYVATGRPISEQRRKTAPALREVEVLTVGLDPGQAALRPRIEARTRAMLGRGLLEEVRGLMARGYAPELRPLQAIGYRQALAVLAGELEEGAAAAEISTATLRYAKRQRTWFRHQARVEWHAEAPPALERARSWLAGVAPSR